MVKRYAPSEFRFYCLTDNPEGIIPEISIWLFPRNNPCEKWWNKMWAFDMMFNGDNILFDLDVIIHGDLTPLFNFKSNSLAVLHAYWKNQEFGYERGNTLYNSSVIKWNGMEAKHIATRFFNDPDYYMLKYKGVDRFLWNEDVRVVTLPNTIAYSYINNDSQMNPNYPICIFNETEQKQSELNDPWISQYWN